MGIDLYSGIPVRKGVPIGDQLALLLFVTFIVWRTILSYFPSLIRLRIGFDGEPLWMRH